MAVSLIDDEMYPANHKTVFVLDHTPYFGVSCGQDLELLRGVASHLVPHVSKSLWTLSLEGALEYCRILWDLFPKDKLVRFYVSDTVAHILNSWGQSQQSTKHILLACGLIGQPPPLAMFSPDFTVLHGLKAAIEGLREPTEMQLKIKNDGGTILNRCRVICVTSARDEESMNRLEELFLTELKQQNRLLAVNQTLPIHHCHLIIINTFPIFIQSSVLNHPAKSLSRLLTTEVFSLKATQILNKLTALVLEHYHLVSTTVTEIPMKPQYNSNSVNDVEIFHDRAAHAAILKGDPFDSAAVKSMKEGFDYETVSLNWCDPKGLSHKALQHCTSVHRITFANVNAPASKGLIKFLFKGHTFALEMPRKSAEKISSHLLTAHEEDVFIHTLCTDRSVLEDLPPIATGCGGQVGDYRMEDFRTLIKQNTLVPIRGDNSLTIFKPLEKVKERLNRQTTFWPLTHSSTLILNLKQYINPLPELIVQQTLTEDEVLTCKKVIFNLIDLELKKEPLNPHPYKQIIKGQTIEEQYKTMWKELEIMLKSNSHSESHKLVYECLPRLYKSTEILDSDDVDSPMSPSPPANTSKNVYEGEQERVDDRPELAGRKLDSQFDTGELVEVTTDNPNPPSDRSKNLYEIFVEREEEKIKNRPELAGRKRGFKLYAQRKSKQSEGHGSEQPQEASTIVKEPEATKTEVSKDKK